MSGVHVGDIGKLIIRNIQKVRQLGPVGSRLIQHDDKFAVGQHGSGRVGLEQILHILADPRGAGPVLADTLPEGKQKGCTVFVLEQQVG